MRSLGGLVLLAGIGVGLFVYLPPPVDRSTSLERMHLAAAAHAAEMRQSSALMQASALSEAPALPRVSSFSPDIPLYTLARAETPAAAAATSTQPGASSGWQAVVATSDSTGDQGGSLTPSDPEHPLQTDHRNPAAVEAARLLLRAHRRIVGW